MIPGSIHPLIAGKKEYLVPNSLRFRASNSGNLSRTPASAGNRKTWTWSAWVKRGTLATYQHLFVADPAAGTNNTYLSLHFDSSDRLVSSGGATIWRTTTAVFRDPAAWYHLVVALDTTQATAADRVKVYVNGTQITSFSTSNNPALDADLGINQAALHVLGRFVSGGGTYFDGYMAEVNFIDGQALTPSSFGQTDSTTGVWIAKKYAGTYGNNGFYLKFSDASAATAAAIGKDSSGNGNNWTPSGISVTSGVTFDQMTDTPTNTFVTWNPLSNQDGSTLSFANMRATGSGGSPRAVIGTSALDGTTKVYVEFDVTTFFNINYPMIGMFSIKHNQPTGQLATAGTGVRGFLIYPISTNGGFINFDGSQTAFSRSISYNANGKKVGVAWDPNTGKGWISVDGSYDGGGDPATGTSPTFTATNLIGHQLAPAISTYDTSVVDLNTGQRAFSYTPPSGFKSLNTANLPTPTIKKANNFFDVVTYTGNGSTSNVSITGLNFTSDMLWFKRRDSSTNGDHVIVDSSRLSQLTSANTFISNTGLNWAGDTGNWVWGIDASNTGIKGPIGGSLGGNIRTGIYYDVDIDANTPFEVEYQLRGTDSANTHGLIAIYRKEDQGNIGTVSNRYNLGMFSSSSTHWVGGVNPAPTIGIGVTHYSTTAEVIEEVSANAVLLTSNVATTNVFVLAREADGNLRVYRTNASGTRVLLKTHPEKTNSIMRVALSSSAEGNNLGLQYLKINLVNVTSTAGRYASQYPNLTTFDKIEEEFVSFNSNGFTIKNNGINAAADGSRITSRLNINAATMVSWAWKEHHSAGFDIVTYTGSGANANISHSLGVAPSMLIVKQRASNTATNWAVWHTGIANTNYFLLNSTAASATGATYWNSITPNSSTFSVGTHLDVNFNNGRYVAYLWSQVEGFSRFGSYTGNGSTDGPFVFCGFRPRYVLIKSTAANDWEIRDSLRDGYNPETPLLFAHKTQATYATDPYYKMDLLANGFKLRNINSASNTSGQTYIFVAYAENSFKYARAR